MPVSVTLEMVHARKLAAVRRAVASGAVGAACDLTELIGEEQVHGRLIDLVKYATDASPYRKFPKVVVSPRTVDEVKKIFTYAEEKGIPVTIRSAGSSLSGQSQGDGILLDARKHWVGAAVEDGGKRLRIRPGTVMFRANLALHPYGYRLGPEPASSGVATFGGFKIHEYLYTDFV